MTRVVNMFAGPGSGKSTTAAGLFFLMKSVGEKVELVTEYAKDLTYEGKLGETTQSQILAKQSWRQVRLNEKVEWIITDSPLLLSLVYSDDKLVADLTRQMWSSFNNLNFYISRDKPFQAYGRGQSEDEAKEVDTKIMKMLGQEQVPIQLVVPGNQDAPHTIMRHILNL